MPRFGLRHTPSVDRPFVMNGDSVQAQGLIGWWPLVEDGLDYSMRSGPPTITGTRIAGQTLVGIARAFGATVGVANTDVLVSANGVDLATLTRVTISAWVYRQGDGASGSSDRMIAKYDGTNEGIGILHNAGTTSYGFIARNSSNLAQWTFTRPSPGAWRLVVFTYDSSSTSNDPIGYLDALVQSLTKTTAPTGTGFLANTAGVAIGNRNNGDRNFNGYVRDVRLYDRIKTAQEVTQMWAPQTRWELYRPSKWRTMFLAPAPATAFRRSLSAYGARVGTRQVHGGR